MGTISNSKGKEGMPDVFLWVLSIHTYFNPNPFVIRQDAIRVKERC